MPATLPGLDRVARAVEDVVRDLERDPEVEPEAAERPARAERAGRLEELPRLQRAALEVRLDGRVRVVELAPLHRLAAGEAEARVGEHRDGADVAVGGELGEGAGEEVVAGRAGGAGAVRGPGGRLARDVPGAVDQVVVDERRHVHELDGDAGRDRAARVRGRAEEREQRPQPLAARRERVRADLGDAAAVRADRGREPLLDLRHVLVDAGERDDRFERRHAAVPVWSATIPPPSRR